MAGYLTNSKVRISIINDGPAVELSGVRCSDYPEGFYRMAVEHGEVHPNDCCLHVFYWNMYRPRTWIR